MKSKSSSHRLAGVAMCSTMPPWPTTGSSRQESAENRKERRARVCVCGCWAFVCVYKIPINNKTEVDNVSHRISSTG